LLVPNEYFESFYTVMMRSGLAMSQFLRAKIFEATLFAVLSILGFLIVGTPNAFVFGIVAGILSFIPYVGPFLGAAPIIVFLGIDADSSALLLPSLIVLLIVNLIDNFAVFPILVGRLVNLGVLTMLASVAVGQHMYGLIGMLLAVPIASCTKIIFQEMYLALYRQRVS
jgi:predicted PurR-regulated permease PerM